MRNTYIFLENYQGEKQCRTLRGRQGRHLKCFMTWDVGKERRLKESRKKNCKAKSYPCDRPLRSIGL
jgi:hypothetical protein